MIYEAEIGNMIFTLNRTIIGKSIERVGGAVREVAILVTVTSAKAQYDMYARTQLGKKFGLSEEKIATIMARCKPADLTEKEEAAYELATVLCQVGLIAGAVYDRCVKVLRQDGVKL